MMLCLILRAKRGNDLKGLLQLVSLAMLLLLET